jgi:4-amino-4-deoxy-L-arabinose transferase-like glycosyltransferase
VIKVKPDLLALRQRPKRSRWLLFALIAFAGLLAFTFQGSRGIWGPDEGRYANVAMEMLDSGDWMVPRRHAAHPQFGKPPLTYWTIAGSVATLGRNEWALRLPSGLAFCWTVALVLSLGRRLTPQRTWLPPMIFATLLAPFVAVNLFTTDMLLTLFHSLAAYAFVRIWHASDAQSAWRFGVFLGVAAGLAFLTRGVIGLLPLLGFALFARYSGLLRFGWFFSSVWISFLAVTLPWYLAVLRQAPDQFGGALIEAMLGGAGRGSFSDLIGGYLPLLALGSLPWIFVLFLKHRSLRRDLSRVRSRLFRQVHQERFFLWCWLGSVLFGVLLLHPREPLTLMSVFVPFAVLIGKELEPRPFSGWSQALLGAWVVILLVIKGTISTMSHPKDTRELAEVIRRAINVPVTSVVFVEESALYGLRYYLDTPIERVSFVDQDDPKVDRLFADAVTENLPGRVWITTEAREAQVLQAAQAVGRQAKVLTRFGRYSVLVSQSPAPP